jgi:hypothetical protein
VEQNGASPKRHGVGEGQRQWRAGAFSYGVGAPLSCGGDGEVLQSKGKKRCEAGPKKEGGGDWSSEFTGRRGWW